MSNPKLSVQLLGAPAFRVGDRLVSLPTRKAEALLAFLSFSPGTFYTRDRLAELLWGDFGEEQARQSLRQTMFTIRKAVGFDIFVTDASRVAVSPDLVEVDLAEYRRLTTADSIDLLTRALDLAHGELLEGFRIDAESWENWVLVEREQFRESSIAAHARLLDLLKDENPSAAVVIAARILAVDPLRESVRRTLMELYMRQGRRDAAIREYQALADNLRRRLGVEPEPATKALYREMLTRGSEGQTDHTTPHILLIEDNSLNRDLIRAMVGDRFDLSFATDGAQALLALGRQNYDLVLLDLTLPTLDGFALMEAMKQNDIRTPVIVITAHQGADYEVRALDAGAADFLRKPIQKEILLRRIARVIGQPEGD